MNPPRVPRNLLLPFVYLAALLAVLATGCAKHSPVGPISQGALGASQGRIRTAGFGSGSFYPLSVGNKWTFSGGGSARVVTGGGSPPYEDFHFAFTESRELIGTTHHEGTAYAVEEQVHHEIPERASGPFVLWSRMRQDRGGLFALDTLLQAPPPMDGAVHVAVAGPVSNQTLRIEPGLWRHGGASDAWLDRFADRVELFRESARGIMGRRVVAGTPSGLELKFLVYPLHPGLAWSTRPDFPWPVSVDGMEALDTPAGKFPAYRISVNPGGTTVHEGEWIYIWYSRYGFLGYSIHTFDEVTDPDGQPTGVVYVYDESMMATSVAVDR